MKSSEVDFEERTWTVPAGRMKMKKQHRVPLSDRAMEILRGLERHAEHVFRFPKWPCWNACAACGRG